jgi:hypothetical protein
VLEAGRNAINGDSIHIVCDRFARVGESQRP